MAGEKKGSKKQLRSVFYDYSGSEVGRKRSFCPKCGPGVFMAEHKDRYTCGSCGYTRWKHNQ
ncbi:MAG: 30S ribosomal protein S27ae [Candidatus Diapherotrites archaeon]